MAPEKRPFDKELGTLCRAINHLPGIRTFTSCSGHDRSNLWIGLEVDNIADLEPLLNAMPEGSLDWRIIIHHAPAVGRVYYVEREVANGELVVALGEARAMATYLSENPYLTT